MKDYYFVVNDEKSLAVIRYDGKGTRYRISKGFEYLMEGFKHPGFQIPTVMLVADKHSFRTIPPEMFKDDESGDLDQSYSIYFQETGIEKSDDQSIREIKNRLNRLIGEIAILQSSEYECREKIKKLTTEKEQLTNYLKEVYIPYRGEFRKFTNESERINKAVYMAISRVYKKLKGDIPELWMILKETVYCWNYLCYTPRKDVDIVVVDKRNSKENKINKQVVKK